MALKRAGLLLVFQTVLGVVHLSTESVQSTSLTLESIDNVHGCDGLPLGVFGVGDSITDDVLKENLEDTTGLFVDESRDTFDTTSASKTTDGGLGDTLDVISQDFTMTLGASFAESLSSFTTSRHDEFDFSNETEEHSSPAFI